MKKFTQSISFVVGALLISSIASAAHLSARMLLSSRMNGGNIVPTAVTTNASGVAGFMLNATRDSFDVNISVTGLSGAITGIHIHEGDAKTNGAVAVDLSDFVLGNICRTKIALKDLPAGLFTKMLTAQSYIAVHTAANPNGEIRGQIKLESDLNSSAKLDTMQQNAPVTGNAAIGLASFNISLDGARLQFNLVTVGLSDTIQGIHLHKGAAGKDGGLLVDLSAFIKVKNANGSIAIPDSLLGGKLAGYIAQGLVYVNVHTKANAGGEVRGQLVKSTVLAYDALVDTFQIVGDVKNANPYGVGVLGLSDDFKSLTYDFLISNTSDTVVAAHFHNGPRNANGPVFLEIPLTGNGTAFSGTFNMTNGLADSIVTELLEENLYLAIHTKANPNGEGRGQLSRLAREGYVTEIDAQQIVGSTTSTATGGGIVSIGRARNDIHYMITVDGLTGPLQAAHLHKQVKGQNGDVLFELPFTNNGAFGYITAGSTPPFTPANELQFRKDSIYVAFHTAANPNGEVRGQFIRNYRANVIVKPGFNNLSNLNNVSLYPNPTIDFLSIKSTNFDLTNSRVIMFDMMGKKVIDQLYAEKVNVSNLNSGLYILNIQNENGIIYSTKVNKN